tara:strand:+ start:258 stop:377 length:120 start_codon:yes stop_codon:yes gene_type:complete
MTPGYAYGGMKPMKPTKSKKKKAVKKTARKPSRKMKGYK